MLLFLKVLVFSETPMYNQLNLYNNDSLRSRDTQLPLTMRLDKWFPHHSKLFLGGSYYLTTPYFHGFRGDFYVKLSNGRIVPDFGCEFTGDAITFKNGESLKAVHLTEQDFHDISGQLALLKVIFRSLGTPLPEQVLWYDDDIESWVVIYENEKKERIIMPSFAETIRRMNLVYQGCVPYFRFNEIRKSNSRLEFFGTIFIRDMNNNTIDFIDVRFHTNRQNQIDLVMFFVYRNTDFEPFRLITN